MKKLLYIVAFFFLIGAIDYLKGDKFKLGKSFEEGIKTMGPLAISMIGILSLTPLLSKVLENTLAPILEKFYLDPSIFPASFIAIDMGAYNISVEISNSLSFGKFTGVLMASILGCTLSFTLPLALGLVKESHMPSLTKGILCGIITIPVGLFVGGILLHINTSVLLINLLPIIILSMILSIGIIYKPQLCLAIFKAIGNIILFTSIVGLIIQGVNSIAEIEVIENIMPLKDVLYIVGKIAIFLAGAYVMLELLKRTLDRQLNFIAGKIGVNTASITAFIGSLASAIIIFSNFDKLDEKGKVLCSAFSVSGAYILGGQLGFVASVEPDMIGIYITTKLIAGILAILFAMYLISREQRSKNKFKN